MAREQPGVLGGVDLAGFEPVAVTAAQHARRVVLEPRRMEAAALAFALACLERVSDRRDRLGLEERVA